jgi:hypothetical protein
VPPLLTFGLPVAQAQTTGSSDATVVAAGDIATCTDTGDDATAALIDSMPGTVLPLGDLAYQDGSKADFDNCYAPTWGRFKERSRPTTGNHEYIQKGAAPYFDYWGPVAGDRSKGYYSFDIGSWHLITLNSTCGAVGGCAKGTPMEQWLRKDLASTKAHCILAYWHHPRFFTPSRQPGLSHMDTSDRKMAPFWADLQAAGADIVLSGHRHVYERFAKQDSEGNADPNGIREFVVGTGGGIHEYFEGPVSPNSEIRKDDTYGVLRLTLHPDSYDWRFVPVAGDSFTDSGSDTCGAPASSTPPSSSPPSSSPPSSSPPSSSPPSSSPPPAA